MHSNRQDFGGQIDQFKSLMCRNPSYKSRQLIFSMRSCMNGVKPTEINSKHLYKTHTAAGGRQWVLAQGRVGKAMWTQRSGGGLWNCRLSRKNKRPAVGAHRREGGKRQLEGSLIYTSAKSGAADLKLTPDYPLQFVWPFDPNTDPPPSAITVFHMCESYHKELCVCRFPSFLSPDTESFTTISLGLTAACPLAAVPS